MKMNSCVCGDERKIPLQENGNMIEYAKIILLREIFKRKAKPKKSKIKENKDKEKAATSQIPKQKFPLTAQQRSTIILKERVIV